MQIADHAIGADRQAGNGTGGMQPGPFQPGLQIVAQVGFAAEEMRHARDIGHQPIDPIGGYHWRVAAGPTPEAGKSRSLAHKRPFGAVKAGTTVRAWPDAKYFESNALPMNELTHLLRSKAVLMPGVAVTLVNEKTKETQQWQ